MISKPCEVKVFAAIEVLNAEETVNAVSLTIVATVASSDVDPLVLIVMIWPTFKSSVNDVPDPEMAVGEVFVSEPVTSMAEAVAFSAITQKTQTTQT